MLVLSVCVLIHTCIRTYSRKIRVLCRSLVKMQQIREPRSEHRARSKSQIAERVLPLDLSNCFVQKNHIAENTVLGFWGFGLFCIPFTFGKTGFSDSGPH